MCARQGGGEGELSDEQARSCGSSCSRIRGGICNGTIDGQTGANNNGLTEFGYTNNTGELKFAGPGGNLHVWNIAGCFGFWNPGDPIKILSGNFALTSKQRITSP